MTKQIILSTTLLVLIGFTGCSSKPELEPIKYHFDKEKSIEHIQSSFEEYKAHKTHKAIAIAMDDDGTYVVGYSYDCASQESAKTIALTHCTKANDNAQFRVNASCIIYAIENEVVHRLN